MKKIHLIILILILWCQNIYSYQKLTTEQIKNIINSNTRIVYDLSGNWNTEENDEISKMFVPSSESNLDKIVISKNIIIPDEARDSYSWHLNIWGIENQVEVFWNNQFIGRFFDSYIPFEIKIPDRYISKQSNKIKLVITKNYGLINRLKNSHLFAKKNYIGVIREIFLIGKPQIWIADIKHNTEFSNNYQNAYINVNFSVYSANINKLINSLNKSDSLKVGFSKKFEFNYQIQLYDKINKNIVASSEIGSSSLESERSVQINSKLFVSNPNLWNTDTPHLYELQIKIIKNNQTIDNLNIDFGFRDIRIIREGNHSTILLNGNEFKIKGISYVEDIDKYGQTISANKLKEDIENIKVLGVNTIRFKYSYPSPYFVYLCNLYGIFLMIELPIYDQPISVIKKDEVQVNIKNNLNLISNNYIFNPSFFAIGLNDGIVDDDIFNNEIQTQILNLKKNYNLLYYQISPLLNSEILKTLKYVDIVGIRFTNPDKQIELINNQVSNLKEKLKDKVLFLDYSVLVQPENHNGYSDPLSIEYQSYTILNFNKIVNNNNLSGSIYNTYNDYLREKPLMVTNNENLYLNSSGITSRDRISNFSFSVLQSIYNNDKEPLLNTGSYQANTPHSFIIFGLVLLIILIVIINQFKRFREYMFRSLLRPYNFYSDIRDQRIISISLTIILGLIISFNIGLYLSSIFYFYKNSLAFQNLVMLIFPSSFVQEIMVKLVWLPELSMLFISLIIFVLSFVTAAAIKIFAIIKNDRILFNDCLILTIWTAIPSLILLPFSIILYRVIITEQIAVFIFLLTLFFVILWVIARLSKSISVVFEIKASRVGIFTVSIFILILIILAIYYQVNYMFFSYFDYMLLIV